MTRLAKPLLALALAAVLALAGCLKSDYEWNQKYLVEAETPDGPRSGASVLYYVYTKITRITELQTADKLVSQRGEAVVVDLGGGKYLFALAPAAEWLVFSAFSDAPGYADLDFPEMAARLERTGGSVALPSTLSPLLVTFADIADPKSVRRVDPDDLDAAFGLCPDGKGLKDENAPWRAEGLTWRRWARWKASQLSLDAYKAKYEGRVPPEWIEALDRMITPRDRSADCRRLKAITLTIVDEAVTEGKVEGVLGWLEAVGRERANLLGKPPTGLVSEQPDPRMYLVSPLDFSTELYK